MTLAGASIYTSSDVADIIGGVTCCCLGALVVVEGVARRRHAATSHTL